MLFYVFRLSTNLIDMNYKFAIPVKAVGIPTGKDYCSNFGKWSNPDSAKIRDDAFPAARLPVSLSPRIAFGTALGRGAAISVEVHKSPEPHP